MRAFVVTKYKEPLQEADVPEPVVGEHDVLVRVDAAGLNPLDEGIRAGGFKQILQYRLPLILGNDIAGTVIRVGAKVRGFKPGDEVYARPDKDRIGTFAERIAVTEADLALKPASISMEEAGSLPLVALTASQAPVERGDLQPGQKVLAHAGGKAIGIAGPPDPKFARESRLNHLLRLAITGLSSKIRTQARKLGVSYEFLFMRASGDQLRQITALVDQGVLHPVVGKVFDFVQTPQTMWSIAKGGIRGKGVVTITG